MLRASGGQILAPLWHPQDYMLKLKLGLHDDDHSSSLRSSVTSCMRDLYHYVRVAGLHVLECSMDTALSAVRNEQLEEVSYVISLFPRLQPLVAVMGWDLLPGKTTACRTLMKLLWTSKPERSCVEYLCESLCYRLDLASFVACVNSGQPWDIRSSLFFSSQGYLEFRGEPSFVDPFVENFVLERLSSQSPIRLRNCTS
ncbi:hypothetical protein Cgig2_006698 [Carnegiea gigantea]|uniref:Uncharacterized protein n=1 Tax=Carnegiea gigantea TaxID=171969 RepID=A0A9Q1JSF0_9CARY|nr:hypothetical protein Cgig2_006698 [Carnegiea gigantea]